LLSWQLLSWASELGTFEDATLQLTNGNPVLWVAIKDHAKNVVQFIRQRQNGLQEITVPGESLVCGILNGSFFPWVASTSKVHKYNTKGPYVVGSTPV
jgi:hypothetical protein